jgi:hypothetical protein
MNLNPAHIHLLLNHIPVFTSVGAALLILWGLLRKSEEVLRLGLLLAIVAALAVYGVKLTGDPAEHTIVGIPGVDRKLIHAHEEAADWAVIMIGMAGGLALIGYILLLRRRAAARMLSILAALVELVGFAAVVRTANLGGEIRHPEIRAGFVPPPPPPRPAGAARPDADRD